MRAKIAINLIVALSFWTVQVKSQTFDELMGRVIYETREGGVGHLEMWFNANCYRFEIIERPSVVAEYIKEKEKDRVYSTDSVLNEAHKRAVNEVIRNNSKNPVVWYGRIETNHIMYSQTFEGKKYCISDSIRTAVWKIQDDTATIHGILCQKAEVKDRRGDSVVAWFAPSIPVSVAPWNLRGLPGLLMKITNLTRNFSMEVVELDWPSQERIALNDPCKDGIDITRQEFESMVRKKNDEVQKLAEYYQRELERKKRGEINDVKIKN